MQASRIDGEELSKVAEKEWEKRELEESNGVSSIFARNHEGYIAARSTSQIMVPEMVTKNTLSAETTEFVPNKLIDNTKIYIFNRLFCNILMKEINN